MTRAAPPAHRPFDSWEKAIIGVDEIRLDPVVVKRRSARASQFEDPPVLQTVLALPPEVPRARSPEQLAVPVAPASPQPTQAPAPVHEPIVEHGVDPPAVPPRQPALQIGPIHLSEPVVRRRGRWRRIFLAVLMLPVIGIVGLVWLGKEKASEPVVAIDAHQELPPSFEAPIKLPPKVAPVTEHRPDQLGEAASGVAPADILAKASADEAAATAPASSSVGPRIPAVVPSPAAPILPPAVLVSRAGGAGPAHVPAAARPDQTPKKSTTRTLVPPSAGASGPTDLFAIGAPSARAASAPQKSDPKTEAASEGVVQPIDAPKAAPATITPPLPDSNGVRRAAYGRSGIVALTPNSVIVYDRERRIQTEVRQGGTLPDGSKVLNVQPNRHRVETDHGTLELSAPNSN